MTLKEFERAVFGRIQRCGDTAIVPKDWDWEKASAWHVWKMGYGYRQNSVFRTRQLEAAPLPADDSKPDGDHNI